VLFSKEASFLRWKAPDKENDDIEDDDSLEMEKNQNADAVETERLAKLRAERKKALDQKRKDRERKHADRLRDCHYHVFVRPGLCALDGVIDLDAACAGQPLGFVWKVRTNNFVVF